MRVLITGAGGQVGRALRASAPENATILAPPRTALDITEPDRLAATVADFRPDLIINAAAYTGVDRAEAEPEQAKAINATAVGYLAKLAEAHNARLMHISTDFVFDGTQSHPYRPDDAANPLNVYGMTKWHGEQAAGSAACIVRTAWVYAAHGRNFVHTILKLLAERDEVGIVADQIGTPTYAVSLANALWRLARTEATGIHHYTDAGVASWYDFAVAIQEEALALGLLGRPVTVRPIAATDYPLPARRPAYSVLDCRVTWAATGGPPPHWRQRLRQMLAELTANG